MTNCKIAIIGVGPRGLAMLERIIAHERENKSCNMDIMIFDPGVAGVGCHDIYQPEYLLVNTVASQITIFSDESVKNAGYILNGPSFYEWLIKHGEKFNISNPDPNTYYPRKIFGHYLHWCYNYLVSQLPRHITVQHMASNVINLELLSNEQIYLNDGEGNNYKFDYAFMTTGHTNKQGNNSNRAIIDNVYPIKDKLGNINRHHIVSL